MGDQLAPGAGVVVGVGGWGEAGCAVAVGGVGADAEGVSAKDADAEAFGVGVVVAAGSCVSSSLLGFGAAVGAAALGDDLGAAGGGAGAQGSGHVARIRSTIAS